MDHTGTNGPNRYKWIIQIQMITQVQMDHIGTNGSHKYKWTTWIT